MLCLANQISGKLLINCQDGQVIRAKASARQVGEIPAVPFATHSPLPQQEATVRIHAIKHASGGINHDRKDSFPKAEQSTRV